METTSTSLGVVQSTRQTTLCVANYRPDVGFAWWLMEHFWIELSQMSRAAGLEPLLLYPEGGPIPKSIREAGIPVMIHAFPGRGLSALVKSLAFVRSRKVRLIYFTDRKFSSFAYALFRLAGVKFIVNHDHTPGDRPPVRGLKALAKGLWRRFYPTGCDLQLCVSALIHDRAISHSRIPARRVAVVQNGIEPVNCTGDRYYAHHQFGLPNHKTICITVGRANPYKRIDFIVEVARRCVFEHGADNLVFVHCGDGPDLERLRSRISTAGLDGKFVLAGKRSDIRALLCSADIAIHAAQGEAFSLAIVEYMSAGLAVLVPDIPTVCQAIRDGDTGMIYPDGNSEAAAKLLIKLVADSDLRDVLGSNASAEVRRKYTLDAMNRSFRQIMSRFLVESNRHHE
jgi:glycosyltransferase involved in cell wall biosynthesis